MIQITPQMRILLSIKAVDFSKGIDGLAEICRHILGTDPFSGCVFVFRNHRGTAIKALMYDGHGFWLCQKRLSRGTFQWWPDKGHDRQRFGRPRAAAFVLERQSPSCSRSSCLEEDRCRRLRPEKNMRDLKTSLAF